MPRRAWCRARACSEPSGRSRCGKRCWRFPMASCRAMARSPLTWARTPPRAPWAPRWGAIPLPGSFRAIGCSAAAARSPAITGAWCASARCWRSRRPKRTPPMREVRRRKRARKSKTSVGEAEHVRHRVEPGLFALAPLRRRQGAAREDAAILGDVAQDQPLMRAGEHDLVLAHHRAAAQAGEADGAVVALAGDAVASARGIIAEAHAAALRRRLAEHQRSAARRV